MFGPRFNAGARRALAIAAGLAALSGAAACDPRKSAGPNPADPNPGAQAPAPAADPMACNPGQSCDKADYVQLRLAWAGERSGKITLHINGVAGDPLQGPLPEKPRGYKIYTGLWERWVSIEGVASVGFDWAPDAPGMVVQCMIYYREQMVDFMTGDRGGPCVVNWTVVR